MLGVLTLFLIPVGGGIPAGVLLAKKLGLFWPVTAGLYFISDVILAFAFEPVLLGLAALGRRIEFVARLGEAFKKSMDRTSAHYGTGAGPIALILVAFGVDPMTGRGAAAAAGHGFLAGWGIAITGDMMYFGVVMAATLKLSAALGSPELAVGLVLAAMFLLPVLVRRVKSAVASRRGGGKAVLGAWGAAFLLSAGLAGAAPAAGPGLFETPGEKIWVFAVSVLEFREKSSYASFPKKDRRDAALVRHFIKERDVPEGQVVWLKDSKATLTAIRAAFRELLARTRKGDLLFFYYTGHGDREKPGVTFFIPYDSASENSARTAWSAPEIIKDIEERFRGDRAILAADCCHSGGLCRQAEGAGRRVSYACLASAQSSSESTGEWTFTDNLLRGLRGGSRADADADGRISLGELADSAESELAFVEGQLSASAATGIFSRDSALAAGSRRETPLEPVLARGENEGEQKGFAGGGCAAKEGPGRRVFFAGQSGTESQCVFIARLRPYHAPAPAFARGAVVYAEWEKTWYKAAVEDFRLGMTHISYDGFGSYWDEWVPAERLRGAPPCSPVPCSVP